MRHQEMGEKVKKIDLDDLIKLLENYLIALLAEKSELTIGVL